ncbi:MAG: CocE/NonD family hydrolase, partial [Mycobacteriales bacterium]
MSRLAERAGGLFTRALSTVWHWPAVVEPDVAHAANLDVPMRDGEQLLADMWHPRGRNDAPTVLVRSPYGRTGLVGWQFGRTLAHQGFRVVLVS